MILRSLIVVRITSGGSTGVGYESYAEAHHGELFNLVNVYAFTCFDDPNLTVGVWIWIDDFHLYG